MSLKACSIAHTRPRRWRLPDHSLRVLKTLGLVFSAEMMRLAYLRKLIARELPALSLGLVTYFIVVKAPILVLPLKFPLKSEFVLGKGWFSSGPTKQS